MDARNVKYDTIVEVPVITVIERLKLWLSIRAKEEQLFKILKPWLFPSR